MLIGLIDTEGGPCLLADSAAAMLWRGSDGDGTDYGQIFALDGAAGGIRVGRTRGVVWDTQGAGTAEVHRVADGTVVLQRAWGENVEPPLAAPGGRAVGTLDVRSGALVVLWSALAWSDLWDPRITDDEQL